MRSTIALVAALLLLGTVAVAGAQTQTGTVYRVDPYSRVVMLDDGRMYRVTPSTVLIADNQPAQLTTLAPGQRVTIQSGEAVVLREGQYVAAAPPPVVIGQQPAVVTQAPPTAIAVPVGVRHTLRGTVTDVDEDGELNIKTDADSFKMKVSREAVRNIKKGDHVTLDVMISPPGVPAASPR